MLEPTDRLPIRWMLLLTLLAAACGPATASDGSQTTGSGKGEPPPLSVKIYPRAGTIFPDLNFVVRFFSGAERYRAKGMAEHEQLVGISFNTSGDPSTIADYTRSNVNYLVCSPLWANKIRWRNYSGPPRDPGPLYGAKELNDPNDAKWWGSNIPQTLDYEEEDGWFVKTSWLIAEIDPATGKPILSGRPANNPAGHTLQRLLGIDNAANAVLQQALNVCKPRA
ncbi:MAG: hypothetical protein H6707_09105 [Deltaproteobacteria bacterium]|nr:hypothetical protein [Deltaproteobacteria bacterium]